MTTRTTNVLTLLSSRISSPRNFLEILATHPPTSPVRQQQRAKVRAPVTDQIAFLRRLIVSLESGQGFRTFLQREYENALAALHRRRWESLVMDGRPFNPYFIAELSDLVISHGFSFSEGCQQFPRLFSSQTIKILEVCERTGNFGSRVDEKTGKIEPSVLNLHLQFLERLVKVRQTALQKLIAPVLTAIVAVLVVLVFIWKVIPVIGELLRTLNVPLNPLTLSLLYLGHILQNFWWLLIGGTGVAVFVYLYQRRRSSSLQALESELLLRIPILNQYLTQLAAYEWVGTFTALVSIGDLRSGLMEAAQSVSLYRFRRSISEATDAFLNGEYTSIAEALSEREPFFSENTSFFRTLMAYKESGSTTLLDDFRREMEQRLEHTLQRFIEMLTPTLTVFLGVVVAYVVLAVYIPIIQVIGALAR
jgi:type II secretory pathway component PulF